MRALVVEDEQALRDALQRDLTAAGFTVDLAADGEEGLFAGTEYPIDVAVIDLGLPKLPGLEVIRRIRRLELLARDRRDTGRRGRPASTRRADMPTWPTAGRRRGQVASGHSPLAGH